MRTAAKYRGGTSVSCFLLAVSIAFLVLTVTRPDIAQAVTIIVAELIFWLGCIVLNCLLLILICCRFVMDALFVMRAIRNRKKSAAV